MVQETDRKIDVKTTHRFRRRSIITDEDFAKTHRRLGGVWVFLSPLESESKEDARTPRQEQVCVHDQKFQETRSVGGHVFMQAVGITDDEVVQSPIDDAGLLLMARLGVHVAAQKTVVVMKQNMHKLSSPKARRVCRHKICSFATRLHGELCACGLGESVQLSNLGKYLLLKSFKPLSWTCGVNEKLCC